MNINVFRKPPRRVRTAYAYFVQDNYRTMARYLGTRQPQPILRSVANQWRNLPEIKKQLYVKREQRDKERYGMAKIEWVNNFGGKIPKLRRRKKDRDAPKRTRNPFMYFKKEMWSQIRMENPDWTQQEIVREIAKRWRILPNDEKEEFIEQTEADKIRYARDLQAFTKQKRQNAEEQEFQRKQAREAALRRQQELNAQQREPEEEQDIILPPARASQAEVEPELQDADAIAEKNEPQQELQDAFEAPNDDDFQDDEAQA